MITATLLTSAITMLTVLIHYEAIRLVHKMSSSTFGGVRLKIIGGVFLLFSAHSVEIWLFAAGIYIAQNVIMIGGLDGAFDGSSRDYLYISAVTYASLGYGDIRPVGMIRTMCGFEALTGVLMMAWSAAYTVSRLENMWHGRDGVDSDTL